ncbi:MAG: DUF3465 domain-containing protein [Gammaproteobacteria bacterium]|nr:DUF3465 domain-containing protein [Gammaproteobacteria bacterium]
MRGVRRPHIFVGRVLSILAILFVAFYAWNDRELKDHVVTPGSSGDTVLEEAFEQRQGNLQVQGSGRIVKLLADDNDGSRHQRFILRLTSGRTLLVAHNIDLAPRIASLNTGDFVEFYGEYEWNPKGGVIHWTHHDPKGRHVSGWLKHNGRTYQ